MNSRRYPRAAIAGGKHRVLRYSPQDRPTWEIPAAGVIDCFWQLGSAAHQRYWMAGRRYASRMHGRAAWRPDQHRARLTMAVDLEAIARRGRCDASSLKLALPLLEQGYDAPFLARYRRDELGGLDEATLWDLKSAVDAERSIADYREELHQAWAATPLADPAIGDAIRKSGSNRTLQRLAKRLRQESAAGIDNDSNRLAVRLLNPGKDDPTDATSVAAAMENVTDAAAAVAGLPKAMPTRLAGDPRVISAAVRWLSRNAKLHISNVHDPHIGAADEDHDHDGEHDPDHDHHLDQQGEHDALNVGDESAELPAEDHAEDHAELSAEDATGPVAEAEQQTEQQPEQQTEQQTGDGSGESIQGQADLTIGSSGSDDATSVAIETAQTLDLPGFKPDPETKTEKKSKAKQSAPKKQKKISPRQRRRRWLVSVLKPLEGKRLPAAKLSAFQVVMLGRALRSQVAVCAFEYDAAKLVGEIKRTVVGLNPAVESALGDVVMQHEADIREAAEAAWWDELHERASARLVSVVADHLRRNVNRGPVDAQVVMSVDAVGPKTAATAIVSADGRVLHGEDLPCQLSGAVRGQTVAKMGELIHQYHVDLVVVSNGPARRACLIALGDLIAQSPDHSVRWTVADRSGADTYSSSDVANSEMRSTPRRFRAAAWIAFSVLHPAQAYAKIDPLRLRLASFQSELSEDALSVSLGHIMSSGASRGGVDANAAPLGWLQQLPGMTPELARALVSRREKSLISSREDLLTLEGWQSAVQTRQAMPFLRVFESQETLDGTLIHPDDYGLAKKLASALAIELPPASPPGYELPNYEKRSEIAEPKLVDVSPAAQPAPVEDFDHAGEKAGDFKIADELQPVATSEVTLDAASGDAASGDAASGDAASGDAASGDAPTNDDITANEVLEESPSASDSINEDTSGGSDSDNQAATVETQTATAGSGPQVIKRPRPESAKIEKCIKEWQVGRHRVHQLVNWLCDPFGETVNSNDPPGVLNTMPTLKSLKQGDQVVGVVVGVMSFGVFVELAPDCSGLIHVSRLSDGYVEDLNEAIQVGDVVTAWVTGIDEKRRRVGLSALSPQREAALEKERETRQAQEPRGGFRHESKPGRGFGGGRQSQPRSGSGTPSNQPVAAASGAAVERGDQAGAGRSGQQRGGQGQPHSGGGQNRDQGQRQGGRGGDQARGGQSRGGQGRGGQNRGGQGRGGQGQGHGGQSRGGQRPRQPESYRVVAKPEAKPISDAMQKGDEPLRSFGDLLQFYSKQEKVVAEPKAPEPRAAEQSSKPPRSESPQVDPAVANSESQVADRPVSGQSDGIPVANHTAASDANNASGGEASQSSGADE